MLYDIKKFYKYLKKEKMVADKTYEDSNLDLLGSYTALLDITLDFFEGVIYNEKD